MNPTISFSSLIDGYRFSASHLSMSLSNLALSSDTAIDASEIESRILILWVVSLFILLVCRVLYSYLHIDEVSKLLHLVVAD